MKKIILASSLLLLTVIATNAQRRTTSTTSSRSTSSSRSSSYSSGESTGLANTILLYGTVGIGSTKSADDKPTKVRTITINPGIGYQFNDNWAVGIGIGFFSRNTNNEAADTEDKLTEFNAGPFIRYTKPLSNIFNVFGQLDLGFKAKNDDLNGPDNEKKSSGVYASVTPAVSVNLKNNFMLNFGFGGLSFTSDKVKDADNAETKFALTFGQQVNIGISKNF